MTTTSFFGLLEEALNESLTHATDPKEKLQGEVAIKMAKIILDLVNDQTLVNDDGSRLTLRLNAAYKGCMVATAIVTLLMTAGRDEKVRFEFYKTFLKDMEPLAKLLANAGEKSAKKVREHLKRTNQVN